MITPAQHAEIRRLYYAEHWRVGTIAAQLGVHHETVAAALNRASVLTQAGRCRTTALDPYLPFVRDTLAQYPRLRATRLHEMLRQRGYPGSAVQVRRAVRTLRPAPAREAYLRLTTLPGEVAQVDWGSFGTIRVGRGVRVNHGAYFYDWTLSDEVAWRNFYQVWFKLVNDYKKMGGRVTVSDDAAFTYNTWGFGYIHEMELLQEAGFHPLEVIRAATMHPAEALHEPKNQPLQFGIIRAGMLADMVLMDQNPLQNLKVLYGTGHVRLNDITGRVERVGGVRYTIKDGIVYDAKKLLADVGAMVEAQKRSRNGK